MVPHAAAFGRLGQLIVVAHNNNLAVLIDHTLCNCLEKDLFLVC